MTEQLLLPTRFPPHRCDHQPHDHRHVVDENFGDVYRRHCTLPHGHDGHHIYNWVDVTGRCETVHTDLV